MNHTVYLETSGRACTGCGVQDVAGGGGGGEGGREGGAREEGLISMINIGSFRFEDASSSHSCPFCPY